MHLRDKILYHQIHPLKLGTDATASVISLWFFWQHRLLPALILHIAPPLIASFLLICFVDLESQRRPRFGGYVKRMMSHTIEAIRLAGDIVMVFGAWYHSIAIIAGGLVIVIGAWLSWLIPEGHSA